MILRVIAILLFMISIPLALGLEEKERLALCEGMIEEEQVVERAEYKEFTKLGGPPGIIKQKGYHYILSHPDWTTEKMNDFVSFCRADRNINIEKRRKIDCQDRSLSEQKMMSYNGKWGACEKKIEVCTDFNQLSLKLNRYVIQGHVRSLLKNDQGLDYRIKWRFIDALNKMKKNIPRPSCQLPISLPRDKKKRLLARLSELEDQIKLTVGPIDLKKGIYFGPLKNIIIDYNPKLLLKYGIESFQRRQVNKGYYDLKHHFYIGTNELGKCKIYEGRKAHWLGASLKKGLEFGVLSIGLAENHRAHSKKKTLISASCTQEFINLLSHLKRKYPNINNQ